ncbi:MAG: alpha/beta hydrolase, partial [Pseudomonadota bacterium]
VAWGVAARAPERVTTLSVFSIPHPGALDAQIADPASCQYAASSYFEFLVAPDNEPTILADNAAILRSFYSGLEPEPVEAYIAQLGTVPALRAALNWYRANIAEGRRFLAERLPGLVSVPTLFVWSSGDAAVCRESAETNADFVTGPYRFEVIDGVGHYIPDEAPDQVTALILEQTLRAR